MSRRRERAGELRVDYYRAMLRRPPRVRDSPAHLVWVRMMIRVLVDLQQWAPNFVTALSARHRSLVFMRRYCTSGAYEQSIARGQPHSLAFLQYFMATDRDMWLKDVARCEVWANVLRGRALIASRTALRRVLDVRSRRGIDYALVSHDALETLQMLIGYADISIARGAGLLWLLAVDPVYPVVDVRPQTGIVIFSPLNGDVTLRFVPADSVVPRRA